MSTHSTRRRLRCSRRSGRRGDAGAQPAALEEQCRPTREGLDRSSHRGSSAVRALPRATSASFQSQSRGERTSKVIGRGNPLATDVVIRGDGVFGDFDSGVGMGVVSKLRINFLLRNHLMPRPTHRPRSRSRARGGARHQCPARGSAPDFERAPCRFQHLSGGQRRSKSMEREVLGPEGLSWGGFTILFVLWVWGERETANWPTTAASPRAL